MSGPESPLRAGATELVVATPARRPPVPALSALGIASTSGRGAVVLGTSGFRTPDAFAVADALRDAGGVALDVARVYGSGVAETMVGAYLRSRRCRGDVVLFGKGAHPPNCDPRCIRGEVVESLRALGTSYLDVWMPHRDDESVPVEEFADAFEAIVAEGLTRAFGVSNWSLERVLALEECLEEASRSAFAGVSNQFSLASMVEPLYPGCRDASGAPFRAWFEASGRALFAWSSQARGYFTSRPVGGAGGLDPAVVRCWASPENNERKHRTAVLAGQLGVPPTAVALAYVLCQPFHAFAVVGCQNPTELADTLVGRELELTGEQCEWLARG